MITKQINIEGFNRAFIDTLTETFYRFGWENYITENNLLVCHIPNKDKLFWKRFYDYLIP